jgi:nicotinamide mononucleotide (NMN) deamidase PncC
VSVTGLAGPGGDDYGNPVGRVYIGYADETTVIHREFTFPGDREAVRQQAAEEVLKLVLELN